MNELPIELHMRILKLLPGLSLQESPFSEDDLRSPTLFPFNVASVCTLWLSILSQIPECWTRVVFDVANDPTPLLDAFLWSNNLQKIELLVFNSHLDDDRQSHKVERRRTFAIAQALRPHLRRCKSIIFDLTYSTSLPPVNIFFLEELPDLEDLVLECRIDNIKITPDSWMTTVANRPEFATSFPNLKNLSLTGFSFMYFALHLVSADWFRKAQLLRGRGAKLTITRFAFQPSGHYTVPNLVYYLHHACLPRSGRRAICFRNLSLSYPYEVSSPQVFIATQLITADIHFHSLSRDFLTALSYTATIAVGRNTTFEGCPIACITSRGWLSFAGGLTLKNIADDEDGSGLRQALTSWKGRLQQHIRIIDCPSFNDSVLTWLKPSEPGKYPVSELTHLYLQDCTNFTPRLLREVIQARNEHPLVYYTDVYHETRVRKFVVTGRGPVEGFGEEDKDWFRSQSIVRVEWTTENDQGIREEFRAP